MDDVLKSPEAAITPAREGTRKRGFLGLMRTVFVIWPERRRQRRHLADLPDHYLRDVGLTKAQARREGARWFFD